MSRIFKRPMFRKGGNVGDGIMTGIVDREMHSVSDPNGVGGQSELKQKNVRVLCISPGSTQTNMGKISKDQDFNTFLSPEEVARYIIFSLSFDKEMVLDESRLNRMTIK